VVHMLALWIVADDLVDLEAVHEVGPCSGHLGGEVMPCLCGLNGHGCVRGGSRV
jgi:hypothetical protein